MNKPSSIFFDRNQQVMRCFSCTKTHPVMAKTVKDPEAMYSLKQALSLEHVGCMAVPVAKRPAFISAPRPINPSLVEAHRLLWGEGEGL